MLQEWQIKFGLMRGSMVSECGRGMKALSTLEKNVGCKGDRMRGSV
ncbi:unnamed protein product [Acanthoscelides obtectus]|uniref:Uncharacterized protein n=1 Tax=Acanthoscelides obtectus TaxID=200917 RepID=A0A9P0PGG4_ACAOB|nr:unnamed protein product [Acanthoscelides obtectus]CAK1674571.1 hypothetical protein AOBTE_LOCUS29665 [Acanthoscelides obtectus]